MTKSSCYATDLMAGCAPQRTAAPAAGASPRTLWIACTDLIMDSALKRIQSDPSVLVWRQFGNTLPLPAWESGEASCSLNDAVERWGIREIVVCGHSMCSGFSAHDGPGHNQVAHGVDALVQRVRQRQAINERAREHVIQQLGVLEEQPAIAHAISIGQLELHGLFYLAESGLFTHYDKALGRFVPLED